MKNKFRIISALMVICMILPFAPVLIDLFSAPVQAASTDKILIYDDFQKGTTANYADSTSSSYYDVELRDGELLVESIGSTNPARIPYTLPYQAATDTTATKLTVSFKFTIIDPDATERLQPSLWLTYGAPYSTTAKTTSNITLGYSGIRFTTGQECIGWVSAGKATDTNRLHQIESGRTTYFEYLVAGSHTMTVQVEKGKQPKMYIDGVNYNSTGAFGSTTNGVASAVAGMFGICLWKTGIKVAIDDFLVYEGHGNLSSTPAISGTIGTPAGAREILVHDDFDDPYKFDYFEAEETWAAGTKKSFENGTLVLDATGATSTLAHTFYSFPYQIPDTVTAFTAEMKFQVLQGASGTGTQTFNDKTYSYQWYNRNDIMFAYGYQGAGDDRVYTNGVATGDHNHWEKYSTTNGVTSVYNQYGYDMGRFEFWGAISGTDSKEYGRLFREMSDADLLGNGFVHGKTYTLVMQVTEDGLAYAYIKEFSTGFASTWADRASKWNGAGDSVLTNHSDISGYLGFFTRQKNKVAIDSITVYDGIYTPPTEKDFTEHYFDEFLTADALDYDLSCNANYGEVKITGNAMQFTRAASLGVISPKLPQITIPASTEKLVLESQFTIDLSAVTIDTATTQDFMLSWGADDTGWWSVGFRATDDSIIEHVLYSNASGHQQGRLWRAGVTDGKGTASSNYIGLTKIKASGTSVTYTLRVVITPRTVRSYFISDNGTRLDPSDDITYTTIKADNQWSCAKTLLSSQYMRCSDLTNEEAEAGTLDYRALDLSMRTGGKVGYYQNYGAVGGILNYKNMRVDYTHTKPIAAAGTTLYYEDFTDTTAAEQYNHSSDAYTAVAEDGILKLTMGTGANVQAYPLPVTLDQVGSFTTEIRFAFIDLPSTDGAGAATSGGKNTAVDLMLLYGSSGHTNTDGDGNLTEGYVAGMRFGSGSEFNAFLQGASVRRAYRGFPTGTKNISFSKTSSNAEEPTIGKYYTMVIEVKNGASRCYFKGLDASGNPYGQNAITDTVYASDAFNSLSTNYVAFNASTYQNMYDFANNMNGQLGLFGAFAATLHIDSISVVAGLNGLPDIKQVADGTVLYENDFNDANIDDYTGQTGYEVALEDGMLSLHNTGGGDELYLLPNSTIAGVRSMTVSFDFIAKDVKIGYSSIMLGYNAKNGRNFRFCGWREGGGNFDSSGGYANYQAFEQYGYSIDGAINRHYRLFYQSIDSTKAPTALDAKGAGTNLCMYSAFLQDGNVHKMEIVITATKAIMYIDGLRVYAKTDDSGSWATGGTKSQENYSTDASSDFSRQPDFASGMLGFYTNMAGTKLKIDNIVAVAGTKDYSDANVATTEKLAAQKTLADMLIDGEPGDDYNSATNLANVLASQHYNYGSPAAYASACRVLWDNGYLYIFSRVQDSTYSARGDKITYYINEDGSLSYDSNEGAYTLTVYRDGTYAISNTNCANVLVKVAENTSNYGVEVKVPLATKKTSPLRLGDTIGFNYAVSDANTSNVSLGWRAYTAGHGSFTTKPDALDPLTLALSASPTGDTTVLWPYFVFGGIALAGALGTICVISRRKKTAKMKKAGL